MFLEAFARMIVFYYVNNGRVWKINYSASGFLLPLDISLHEFIYSPAGRGYD